MGKTTKPPQPRPDKRRMNASEAVVSFVSLLTTRPKTLIFDSKHDCTPISQFMNEFIQANNLPAVREELLKSKPLNNVDDLTNDPGPAPPPDNVKDAVKAMWQALNGIKGQRMVAVGLFMQEFRSLHNQTLNLAENAHKMAEQMLDDARNLMDVMRSIEMGTFNVLMPHETLKTVGPNASTTSTGHS